MLLLSAKAGSPLCMAVSEWQILLFSEPMPAPGGWRYCCPPACSPLPWPGLSSTFWTMAPRHELLQGGDGFPNASCCKSSEVLQCPGSTKEAGRAEETTRGGLGAQLGGPSLVLGLLI